MLSEEERYIEDVNEGKYCGTVERFSVSEMTDAEYEKIAKAGRGSGGSVSQLNSADFDFLEEAHKLIDNGQAASMTEAMRKVNRDWPELHAAFKEKAMAGSEIVFSDFKRNEKFVELCRLHALAIEQAERAKSTGHSELVKGVLAEAGNILLRMKKLIREEQTLVKI